MLGDRRVMVLYSNDSRWCSGWRMYWKLRLGAVLGAHGVDAMCRRRRVVGKLILTWRALDLEPVKGADNRLLIYYITVLTVQSEFKHVQARLLSDRRRCCAGVCVIAAKCLQFTQVGKLSWCHGGVASLVRGCS